MIGNRVCIETDLSNYIKIENAVANVFLPNEVKPKSTDNSCLEVLYLRFNPKLVYGGDIDETIEGWEYLQHNIDLGEATSLLAMSEITRCLKYGFWPAIPAIIYPLELAYFLNYLRMENVKNLEMYIPKVRREIMGAIRSINRQAQKSNLPFHIINTLEERILSFNSEFRICKELVDMGYDVKFNPHKTGPDLYLNGVKVEITRRIDRLNRIQEIANKKTIKLNPGRLLPPGKLGHEFKQGDIVIADVTSTLEGSMLLLLKHFSKDLKLDLSNAINQALELVDSGRKAIILYYSSGEDSISLCINAERAEEFMKSLIDEINKRYILKLIDNKYILKLFKINFKIK